MSAAPVPPALPAPRLAAGALFLMGGRLTTAACTLIQVPLVLAALGPERFGLWVVATGLMWTLTSFDGGLGFALQNRVAVHLALGRTAAAAALAARGWRWLGTLAAALALAAFALAAGIDFAGLFGLDALAAREVAPALVVAAAGGLGSLPLALGTRLAFAVQESWIPGLWSAAASLAALAATAVAAGLGAPPWVFVAASALVCVLPPLAVAQHLRARHAWLRAAPNPAESAPPVRAVAAEGAEFFAPQLGAAVIGSFLPVLVATHAGPVAAGAFGVVQRLFGLALQVQTIGLQPTWPAYTHAAARGDDAAARRVYRRALLASAIAAALILGLALAVRPIVALWLREAAPALPTLLVWSVALWNAVQCFGQPPAMVLNGTGRTRALAFLSAAGLAAAFLLAPLLGPRWGAVGVIAAFAVPYVLGNLPVIYLQAHRALAAIGTPTRP